MDFSELFNPLGNSTCSSPEVVLAFLLETVPNISKLQLPGMQSHVIQSPECLSSVSDLRAHWICTRQLQTSNSCISTPTENWTHVCMNLFTRNCPYYHLLKYLLFLLKHLYIQPTKCTSMFMMYFIHNVLSNIFRPLLRPS